MKIISRIIIFLLVTLATNQVHSQFSFKQLTDFIKKPYDSLDNVLSTKGFNLIENSKINDLENSSQVLWKNSKSFEIGILSIPDTVTLRSNQNEYLGYTDVLKNSLLYVYSGETLYNSLITSFPNSLKRINSYISDKNIITVYENDDWIVELGKQVLHNTIYRSIKLSDKAYIILDAHYTN